MSKEIKVRKSLAEELREKKRAKERKALLENILTLERASQPVEKNGEKVLTENAIKAKIILEVYGGSLAKYTQIWKAIVDHLKDFPSDVEDVYNKLQKKDYQDVEDEDALKALAEWQGKLSNLIKNTTELRQKMIQADEEVKAAAEKYSPNSDVVAPADIDLSKDEGGEVNPDLGESPDETDNKEGGKFINKDDLT